MDNNYIKVLEENFYQYFCKKIINKKPEQEFINLIKENTEAVIFGGIIRDFIFMSMKHYSFEKHRDIDIVVDNLNDTIKDFVKNYIVKETRFGGLKLKIEDTQYDLWSLRDTWTYRTNFQIDYLLAKVLPKTSFFNITAIVFSLNERKFYYHKGFWEAIINNKLDIINYENPYPELCIVKSLEYCNKFKMKISKNLKTYIIVQYPKVKENIISIQEAHYNTILFSKKEIESFVDDLTKDNITDKRNKRIVPENQLILDLL